jgi:hypothetical protein
VSHTVLALLGNHISCDLFCLDAAGRARGLSGAPDGARGMESSSELSTCLDPDGWLARSLTKTVEMKVRPRGLNVG